MVIGGANRISYGDAPLPTTLTVYRFKAVQKTFSNNRGHETAPDGTWSGFEFTRTLFARTDMDAPPVVADTEVIYELRPPQNDPNVIVGRMRIADYLTPNDQLYFEAGQRAVSLSDYTLSFTRRQDITPSLSSKDRAEL